MKKLFALLLSTVMLLSLCVTVFASDEEKFELLPIKNDDYYSAVYAQIVSCEEEIHSKQREVEISDGMYLYSLGEQPIAVFYSLSPQGYAILDYKNGVVLEYSTEQNHPFYRNTKDRYYYDGVFNYYIKVSEGKFQNLATQEVVSAKSAYVITSESFYADNNVPNISAKSTSEGPVYLTGSTRLYNCNVTSNFQYFYPNFSSSQINSVPGVCGSVACAIVVAYMDDYKSSLAGSGDFATDWKKRGGTIADNTYGKDLVKEFVGYVEPSGNGSFLLNPGMSSYLKAHNISGGCTLGLISVYIQTKNSIKSDGSGNPIIIGLSDHYCVGTGYKNISGKQVRVNTGWGTYSWIAADTIVSTWTLFLN